MSRKLRSYLPGAAFHLTSRTTGRAHWFADDETRNRIVEIVASALRRTDARLIALAIMPNHFHFVLQQGSAPLSRFMQPVCRRTALLIQRKLNRTGHIFEANFFDIPCETADHLRHAIYYTHRNPVKAKLCADLGDYAWSSHHAYAGTVPICQGIPGFPPLLLSPVPELFACRAGASDADMHAGYMRFAQWRMHCDSLPKEEPRPPGPVFPWGDVYWGRRFRPALSLGSSYVPDLRDLVLQTLRDSTPAITLEQLLMRRRTKASVDIRREVIRCALAVGHRNVSIARFLNVSETMVSRVAAQLFIEQSTEARTSLARPLVRAQPRKNGRTQKSSGQVPSQ
jgi:putative transposase